MLSPQNRKLAEEIPPLKSDELEGRFQFIEDDILRTNTALALQHVIVLIAVMDRENADGTTIASSIYKDMIVHYATITEGCLHYCLKRCIAEGVVKSSEVMPKEWRVGERKILHKISSTRRVCGIIEHESAESLKDKTNFIVVSRAAKKAGILTKDLYEKVDSLREQRNNIHLVGLRAVDNLYTKADAQKASDIMTEVIERVEKKLMNLKGK